MTTSYYEENKNARLVYQKVYDGEHPEKTRKHNNDRYLRLKQEVLTHYSNGRLICVKCGFNDIRALSIDHIDGGGNQFRQITRMTSSYTFYGWLKRNGYPIGYQTLCMNCQVIK